MCEKLDKIKCSCYHNSMNKVSHPKRPSIAQNVKRVLPKSKIELTDDQLASLERLSEIALGVVAVAGIGLLAIVAPNVLQLLNKTPLGRKSYRNFATKKREQQKKIIRTFYYLRSRGYIELVPQAGDYIVKITRKGRERVVRMNLQTVKVPVEKNWDGRWWAVMADIPTKIYRNRADLLRQKIKDMQFYRLQKTVWMFPFDPRDQIDFISRYYGIDRYITVMEVCGLDQDDEKRLRDFFKKAGVL